MPYDTSWLNIGYDKILVELMINQEGIHQLYVVSLNSMIELRLWPRQFKWKKNIVS